MTILTVDSWIVRQLDLFPGNAILERYAASDRVDRSEVAGNEWIIGVLAPLMGKDGWDAVLATVIEEAQRGDARAKSQLELLLQRAQNEKGAQVVFVADRAAHADLQAYLEASNQLIVLMAIAADPGALLAIRRELRSLRSTGFLPEFATQTIEWAAEFAD